jgi:hypothetical protein
VEKERLLCFFTATTVIKLQATAWLPAAKTAIFEQYIYENDHFAKTGSGQTWVKLKKSGVFRTGRGRCISESRPGSPVRSIGACSTYAAFFCFE